jgi:hypothetical protein
MALSHAASDVVFCPGMATCRPGRAHSSNSAIPHWKGCSGKRDGVRRDVIL